MIVYLTDKLKYTVQQIGSKDKYPTLKRITPTAPQVCLLKGNILHYLGEIYSFG